MPKAKDMGDYLGEFYQINLKKKYGPDSVTPEIYKKELLKYIKTMDPLFALQNIVEFINQSAYDVCDHVDTMGNKLKKNHNLMAYNYIEGLLDKNIPSKEVYDSIESSMKKDAFVNYCNQLNAKSVTTRKDADIEYRMNKFKMIEAVKPKGNAFTKFFKKLFNIGGYNDKVAAYENCKRQLKEYIGDRLSDEDFEREIVSDKSFSSGKLNKVEKVNDIKEFDNVKEKPVIKVNAPEKENTKNLIK